MPPGLVVNRKRKQKMARGSIFLLCFFTKKLVSLGRGVCSKMKSKTKPKPNGCTVKNRICQSVGFYGRCFVNKPTTTTTKKKKCRFSVGKNRTKPTKKQDIRFLVHNPDCRCTASSVVKYGGIPTTLGGSRRTELYWPKKVLRVLLLLGLGTG